MESIAYQELALTWEAARELESFELVDWKKLSTQGFICFLCLGTILSFLTAAETSLAQSFTGFPPAQGPISFRGQIIQLPTKGFFQRGDRSSAVTVVQEVLQTLGYFRTAPTGFYGPITEDAVRRFQGDRGITTNGLVGPTTLSYLLGPVSNPPNFPNNLSQNFAPISPFISGTSAALSIGSSGPEVGLVQQRLQQLGFYFGPINNYFDINTQQAVLQFQQANNITSTGRVGPTTKQFLFNAALPPDTQFPSIGTLPQLQLRRGDRGFSVRVLQSFLNRLGYQAGSVDGVFGSTTELAVRQLQQDVGLIPNGEISRDTLSAITNYFGFSQLAPTANSLTVSQFPQNYLGTSPVGSTQNYPTASPVGYTVSSSVGNNPSEILAMQRRLNLQGLYFGPFDGIYNSQMQEAIARAQQLYGISAVDILLRP